jgi:hypothetical protein
MRPGAVEENQSRAFDLSCRLSSGDKSGRESGVGSKVLQHWLVMEEQNNCRRLSSGPAQCCRFRFRTDPEPDLIPNRT